MAKHEEAFSVPLVLADAVRIGKEAVEDIGWRVLDQRQDGLRCRVAWSIFSTTWPITVTMVCSGNADGSATILLSASNFGFGPVQAKHVTGPVGTLRNRIELIVARRQE